MPRPRDCEPEIGLAITNDWRGTTSHPERDTSFSFGQEARCAPVACSGQDICRAVTAARKTLR